MNDSESTRQAVQSPAPFSTWLGVVLLFAIFGVLVLVIIGSAPRGDTYEQTRARNREQKLKALSEENTKMLTTYGWTDKSKGVARIPISRAIELTIAELANKKPQPAYPIATPEPQASAAAPAASPAASPQAAAPPKPSPASSAKSPAAQPSASAAPATSPQAPVSPSPAASASPVSGTTP
jgi:hypothetical protein